MKLSKGLPSWMTNLLVALALVVIWELLILVFRVPEYLVPSARTVLQATVDQWQLLLTHTLVTLVEVAGGFVAAAVLGIGAAVLLGYSEWLRRVLMPVLVLSQTVPKIAIAPLLLIWFGYGMAPKIIITFLICFFPIVISALTGFVSMEKEVEILARSMGASGSHMFAKFRFPAALPFIFSGLKVSITLAVVGAIVGEFVGSDRGLGYLLLVANSNLDTPLLFSSLIVLTIIGMLLFYFVETIERWSIPWHVSQQRNAFIPNAS
jgi:NitT/TauT family transport system permease protein